MSLKRLYRRTINKPLKVYWWRYDYPNKLNFGDELTPILIERLFGINSVWSEPNKCELIGAGSIIEAVSELSDKNPVNVWGSGFIKEGSSLDKYNLKFHAVRGKKSLSRIHENSVALGDPGLLASLAFPSINPQKKMYKLGIVAHYVDADSVMLQPFRNSQNSIIINPLWPVEKVLETIASCELVFSSSLHGLIISDAFGIPNYWTPLSNLLTGGSYKFNDYYSVFDSTAVPIKMSSNESDMDDLINNFQKKTSLEAIQQNLIRSFPY